MTEILTSLCGRLYGRGAGANRAARAVESLGQGAPRALQAYRFALDPTPAQDRLLRSHCGAGRVACNWGLGRVKAVMGQREAEATYGVSKEDLTPAVSWSLYSLRKEWNVAKAAVAPWWGECSKEAFNAGLDNLARALKNWGDSRSGKRKGAPVGFPRFKSSRRSRLCPFHHRGDPVRDQTRGVAPAGQDQDA